MDSSRAALKERDKYVEHVIDRVDDEGGRPVLHFEDGLCLAAAEAGQYPVTPRVGMRARLYGKGFGYPVRGLDVDGREVYYRTEDEDRAEHAAQVAADNERKRAEYLRDKSKIDERIAALPSVLGQRIAYFMGRDADWCWQFLGYELFCCEQAVALRAVLGNDLKDREKVAAFQALPWTEQRARVPAIDDGHSGNTFGFSLRLAVLLECRPDVVLHEHGALCPLVGCHEYGCWASDIAGQAEVAANAVPA